MRLARCAFIALGAVLIGGPTYAAPSRTTEATLNVYRGNPAPAIRADVREAMRRATLIRLQETYRPKAWAAVREAVRGPWRVVPGRTELTTLYDSRVWRRVGPPSTIPMPGRGFGPRWLTWQVFRYRPTGALVRVANTHADPGCGPSTWAYAARVRDWTRARLVARPLVPILTGGDTNCALWLWGERYRRDRSAAVDKLATSRTPGAPRALARWSIPAHSDHRLQLRRLQFLDNPRPRD